MRRSVNIAMYNVYLRYGARSPSAILASNEISVFNLVATDSMKVQSIEFNSLLSYFCKC